MKYYDGIRMHQECRKQEMQTEFSGRISLCKLPLGTSRRSEGHNLITVKEECKISAASVHIVVGQ